MTAAERIRKLQGQLPAGGLFREKNWLWSDRPLVVSRDDVRLLEGLGRKLYVFLQTADRLYRDSVNGQAPGWIAEWLDQGKPEEVVRLGREQKGTSARILRPDLILTEEGWALTEIDSVPGGIGLTAWMQEQYAQEGFSPLGGTGGMRSMVQEVLGDSGEVLISQEAADYRPEWEWLLGSNRVQSAENYRMAGRSVYRFFEMFDWMQMHGIRETWGKDSKMDAPPKAYLEEKLWWALFWMKPLEERWRRELGEGFFKELRALVPRAWPLRPMELPPEAVLPDLGIQSWTEMESFSQKSRDLIIKVSGFSPRAWGSRGVFVGSDHPLERWVAEVRESLKQWPREPRILQRFSHPGSVTHPVWSEEKQEIEEKKWRLRVCPYYLVMGDHVQLKGVLATLCPLNKKIIHGMQDAVLVPVSAETATGGNRQD